ncbi:hypothetical protein DFAR_1070009 [Desulfarculales bacterium]
MEFTPYTPNFSATPGQLWDELLNTRQRSYGISDRESSMVLYSVAAPIIDGRLRVLAAINGSMYAELVDQNCREELTRLLLAEGRRLSPVWATPKPIPPTHWAWPRILIDPVLSPSGWPSRNARSVKHE